jgi:hypothetical protein
MRVFFVATLMAAIIGTLDDQQYVLTRIACFYMSMHCLCGAVSSDPSAVIARVEGLWLSL